MKSILITGAGSYIGVSLENYLGKWPETTGWIRWICAAPIGRTIPSAAMTRCST